MKKCVFAGTFDPPTTGHYQTITECLALFDEVVVALSENTQKEPCFTLEERKALLEKLFDDNDRVKIVTSSSAVVDLLKKENTVFYVRGVRNTVDFEYENANFFANCKLMPEIITVYLPARQQNLHISSTLVRNSFKFRTDYTGYVPDKILKDVEKLMEAKNVQQKD